MIGFTAFVFFMVPETKNKTFEEIASVFQPGGDIEVEEVIEEGDVFADEQPGEAAKLMGDGDSKQNGSKASLGSKQASTDDVRVKADEEKQTLTKSAENVHTLEAWVSKSLFNDLHASTGGGLICCSATLWLSKISH